MYTADSLDEVLNFEGIPGHSPGAPMPQILANDVSSLLLAYEVAPGGEEYAIVKFIQPRAHYFGSPNDETMRGYPLAERGLRPYGVFEVRNSSWIGALEQMNRAPSQQTSRVGLALTGKRRLATAHTHNGLSHPEPPMSDAMPWWGRRIS